MGLHRIVPLRSDLALPSKYKRGTQREGLAGHLFWRIMRCREDSIWSVLSRDCALYFSFSKNAMVWSHTHRRQKANIIVCALSADRIHATALRLSAMVVTRVRSRGGLSQSVSGNACLRVISVYVCATCNVRARSCKPVSARCRDLAPEHGRGSVPRSGAPLWRMCTGNRA